ncbi:TolB family protein [Actinoplanes philippinensis]|uniref:TolB family protein n=1 Tax=Actinoplanes philippinensis TaxID=35752 RepID=UPI0033CA07AA
MRSAQLPEWTNRLAKGVALTAAFAVAAFGCGFGAQVFEWHPIGGSSTPGEQGAATLPARIGAPAPWTPDLEDAPVGAASILYSSNTWFPNGSDGLGALVGRGDDTYRVTGLSDPAGMGSVLSPDGARLASSDGIVDLATGEVTGWGPQWGDDVSVEPEAWSPDGRTVAVLAGDHLDPGLASDTTKLYLYDVAGGTPREVTELNRVVAMSGWTAAFAPDGARLAYQNDGRLSVLTLAGATTADVPIPAGARLAGRGAWTRDGRNLLVTTGAPCDCGGHPMRWTVTAISAADGTATGTAYSRDGSYALRVLGWWPSGRPVAVEYTPVEGAEATIFDKPGPQYDLASQEQIKAARLIDLGTGTILTDGDEWGLAGDVESIDVADSVLARGEIRSGSAPLFDADGILVTVLGIVAVALLILISLGAWRLVATLTRRR